MPQIDNFLNLLLEQDGSDLHLSAGAQPMIRASGAIQIIYDDPLTCEESQGLIEEIIPAAFLEKFEKSHDVDFCYEIPEVGRFRVNVFVDRKGIGAVFRYVPSVVPTMDDLDLPAVIRSFAELPRGIVLVTGPTGSGKSTTLATIVNEINQKRRQHIITVEDPIEFVHQNKNCLVNQREVGTHTDSFAIALRAALREDPDVILVGEMRDLETTAMAIEAAETGHLVFSTLHTSSAASTVDRIIDQFPGGKQAQVRTMLASSLKGVVSQSLLARTDRTGRAAAFEVLVATPAVAAMIRDGKTHQIPSAMQTGGRLGMTLLNESICKLVGKGIVDPEEGYMRSPDKEGLLQRFNVAHIRYSPDAPESGSPARSSSVISR